jgi:hypothetical protein
VIETESVLPEAIVCGSVMGFLGNHTGLAAACCEPDAIAVTMPE